MSGEGAVIDAGGGEGIVVGLRGYLRSIEWSKGSQDGGHEQELDDTQCYGIRTKNCTQRLVLE